MKSLNYKNTHPIQNTGEFYFSKLCSSSNKKNGKKLEYIEFAEIKNFTQDIKALWRRLQWWTNPIFFADCYNLRKFTKLPFHAIYTLNNNHYLFPRPVSPGLSLRNLFPQNFLQVSRCCKQRREVKIWVDMSHQIVKSNSNINSKAL